jgi:peptide chain release factor subunit 1
VTRSGFLEEVAGLHDDPFGYRKRNTGGLNHKRYQRRIENKREAFAREAAALEELVTHEGARRVILAVDAVAIPLLHQALSPLLEPLIHEEILRLDIRTPRHEALSEIAPILTQMEEEEESHARADRLVEAVREQGLGVIGLQETRDALEHGEGEVLVLAEEAPLDEQERNDLVRLVTLSGAEVDMVKGHETLQQMGGVGALLRYRPMWV